MIRYFKYIFPTLITVLLAVSCIEEIAAPEPMQESESLTLVPRVKSFTNQYVTKAGEDEIAAKERKITSLAVLVFNSEGELVYHNETPITANSPHTLPLNKTMLNSSADETAKLESANIVMFANISLADIMKKNTDGTYTAIGNSPTLEELNDCSIHMADSPVVLSSDLETFGGFPMKGVATANLTIGSTAPIVVNLQILYAKVNFEISVEDGGENQKYNDVANAMTFTLNNCKVFNTSKQTSFAYPTESGSAVLDIFGNATETTATVTSTTAANHENTDGFQVSTGGTATLGDKANNVKADKINFTFYVSENRYNPNSDLSGVYPDDEWLTSKDYEDYKQHYKPAVAKKIGGTPVEDGTNLATHVKINGTYVDYRGTSWNVDYTVYLGKDNYQNFQVDRNSEYTNHITIKGIRNNDTYTDAGSVWIDHRVNVSTNDPSKHVTITRETLIDSHIEVRPLRVKWDGDTYAGVRVYLPTDSKGKLIDWIGIERFTGENCRDGSTYCYVNGQAIGKRKYFTTSLISELQSKAGEFGVQEDNDEKFIYLLNGECAWIYFDEYTGSQDREARIKLTFYSKNGNTTIDEEYHIIQRGLQFLNGYAVESFEEYLHSYDSADKYNLATTPYDYTQQGFKWGLSDKSLSSDIIVSPFELNTITLPLVGNVDPKDYIPEERRYDYSLSSDGQYNSYIKVQGSWTAPELSSGLDFTKKAGEKALIKVKDMGSKPENAYQYCLSKNKFEVNEDGTIEMKIKWYLPDCYELQSVLNSVDVTANDFKAESLYWSSQPSSVDFGLADLPVVGEYLTDYSIKDEDQSKAKAASKTQISDAERTDLNRIRCFYDSEGKDTDMSGRVPDGIGGNHTFYMRAWETWNGNSGYFSGLPANDVVTGGQPYTLDDYYDFPKDADDGNKYFGNYVKVDNGEFGFEENPRDPNKQDIEKEGVSQQFTSYVALQAWPGLTTKRVVPKQTPITDRIYYDLEGNKEETMSVDTTWCTKYDGDILTDSNLSPILLSDPEITISFSQGNNDSQKPNYYYYRPNRVYTESTTRTWQLPEYETVYKTDWATQDPIYTPSGTVQLTDRQRSNMERFSGREVTNSEGYIYVDASSAQTAGENYTLPEGAVRLSVTTEREYGVTIYKYKIGSRELDYLDTRYRFKITYKLPGQQVPHYKYSGVGGCWDEVQGNGSDTTTPASTPPETDELKMYCGNSFKISVNDSAYEITKVRVYYTGNNYIGEYNSIFGLGGDNVYARFVDNSINLDNYKLLNVSVRGSSEKLQLPGMDYSEDGEDGWHQWSGDGLSEITLVLADYNVNYNRGSISYSYLYDKDPINEDKYIVIDRIEVKCTKKNTTSN